MRMVLWQKIRSGMVALSPLCHWTRTNATASKAAPTKSPITSAEPHGLDWPPHCSARTRQQTAPMTRTIPGKSRREIFSLKGINAFSRTAVAGNFRMKKIMTKATAPIGRFLNRQSVISFRGLAHLRVNMQETYIHQHHLQDTWSVKTPPTGGPKQVARPKTLRTTPMVIGLFSSTTVRLMIARAP